MQAIKQAAKETLKRTCIIMTTKTIAKAYLINRECFSQEAVNHIFSGLILK